MDASTEGTRKGAKLAFRGSLRARLVFAVTALIGCTAVLLSMTDYRYVRGILRDSVQQQLELHTQGLKAVLLGYVRQQHERAVLVSSRTRLRALLQEHLDNNADEARFRNQTARILRDARDSTAQFLEISIAAPDGRIITATAPFAEGASVAGLPAFQEGLQQPVLGLPTPVDDDGYRATLRAPARTNDGRLLGVVLVELDVEPIRRVLNSVRSSFESGTVRVGAQQEGRIRYLFPVQADGHELFVDMQADPVMRDALTGKPGFRQVRAPDGTELLVSYRDVGYREWALVSQVNASEAYAVIQDLRTTIVIGAILIAMVAAIVGIRLAGVLTRPVLELAHVANRVRHGDLSARTSTGGPGEIGILSAAFNDMAVGLERHQHRLQELVEERTRALNERTAQLQRSHNQLANLCQVLENQADVMQRDLHRAEVIQRSLLPNEPPAIQGFCVQTLYRPGRAVGGDLYDVVSIANRYLVMVVADASGHGVSAAMLAVLFKHRLRIVDEHSGSAFQPAQALTHINTALHDDVMAPGVFFTCAYCILDSQTHELVMASAGHPPLLWLHNDGEVEQLEHTGPALGLYEDAQFEERRIKLEYGDRVLLYTDGLFDVSDTGSPDVETIAASLRSLSPHRRVLEQVLVAVSGGQEREDRDDVTMLLLDARPGVSQFYDSSSEFAIAPQADAATPGISIARDDNACFICIVGRVTWTYGEVVLEQAKAVLEPDATLIFDLSECEYLDSTMLGTLHEIVAYADTADVEVVIQGAAAGLRDNFEELSMHSVLARCTTGTMPVPSTREPLALPEADPSSHRERLLTAHETLSSLSAENEAQFASVVEALKAQD